MICHIDGTETRKIKVGLSNRPIFVRHSNVRAFHPSSKTFIIRQRKGIYRFICHFRIRWLIMFVEFQRKAVSFC